MSFGVSSDMIGLEGAMEAPATVKKVENLTIRQSDEVRIVAAVNNAGLKLATGSVFSVKVDLSLTGTLCIGVKDLPGNLLAVSMLKRVDGEPGSGELAGIRLGDIIFGVNFVAAREGSKTLLQILKSEGQLKRSIVHLQCWRCHQLCSQPAPGATFKRADYIIIYAYSHFKSNGFTDWERWNFVEILLRHMLEEMKIRATLDPSPLRNMANSVPLRLLRAKQQEMVDIDRNLLQAKAIRPCLCIRVVHTKNIGETVCYVVRVEDVETGVQWLVNRRFSDFYHLSNELSDLSPIAKEISFPSKRIALHIRYDKLIDQRVTGLEAYMRRCFQELLLHAHADLSAARALRHIQHFLSVEKYVDSVHPPSVDDQRCLERIAFEALNMSSSPACQQVSNFLASIDLNEYVESGSAEGYRPMLSLLSRAMAEMEENVRARHAKDMEEVLIQRKLQVMDEYSRSFINRCIRRQVELAMFLPVRRELFKIIFPFVALQALKMQQALEILQEASPTFFGVDICILSAQSFPSAVQSFREVIHAYVPSDQSQLLMHTAAAVISLHKEYSDLLKRKKASGGDAVTSAMQLPATPSTPAAATGAGMLTPHSSSITSHTPNFGLGGLSAAGLSNEPVSETSASANDMFMETSAEAEAEFSQIRSEIAGYDDILSLAAPPTSASASAPAGAMFSPATEASRVNSAKSTVSHSLSSVSSGSSSRRDPVSKTSKSIDEEDIALVEVVDDMSLVGKGDQDGGKVKDLLLGSVGEDDGAIANSAFCEPAERPTIVSADDFLPLFTFVMVRANMPQLTLAKELMSTLVAEEESFGEFGYYMATLEAAVQHVTDLARQYQESKQDHAHSIASTASSTTVSTA